MTPLAPACLLALTWPCLAWADPPRVLRANPDHGETAVDPALTQLRIEFDQDMLSDGRSICGGGDQFPEFTGDPRWESSRVLVVPVALKPGHAYRLSINCPASQNFRSVAGGPAEITPISFKTAAPGKAAPPRSITPKENAQAIKRLKSAISERYSYHDLRVKDWNALFQAHHDSLSAAQTPAAFARAAARLLAPAQDVHISVVVGDAQFPGFRARPNRNLDPARIAATVPDLQQSGPISRGRCTAGPGYIRIDTWAAKADAYAPAHDALDALRDCPAIIIDVRANGGGDESVARKFAARFCEKPAVYSRSAFRDDSTRLGWTDPIDREVEPAPSSKRYRGKVAVLIGQGCMSSNESFILMMKFGAGALLVGDRTYGASGNPRPHNLGNGVTVLLPSWKDLLPDGSSLEGAGIAPDIAVPFPADDPQHDPVLDAAVDALAPADAPRP